MKTRDFAFWTPGRAPTDDGHAFGCASHGIAAPDTWRGPDEAAATRWPATVQGEVVAGRYDEVLAHVGRLSSKPAAAIVLFAHGMGMEAFLERWHALLPDVPTVGGGAARASGRTDGELLPAAEDVAVLLIADGAWRAETLNVHERTGVSLTFQAEGLRTLTHLRESAADTWQPAATFFRSRQADNGRLPGDCESITFCDLGGRNVHASFDGDRLRTGADLPADGRLELRIVSRTAAARRLAAFCAVPDALVFGCAGLRSLLDAPLPVAAGTLVGFMFGELVTLDTRPQFGNLMAARLVRGWPLHSRQQGTTQ